MSKKPLLIEIGCEEIPARMIPAAASDFARRVPEVLRNAGLEFGDVRSWGGTRRLAVVVDAVVGRQEDRDEQLLGPPASVAFKEDGTPGPAAIGFARKQGIEPADLKRIETEKGAYVGLDRRVEGKTVGQVLAGALPAAVEGMWFPKTMRWGEGKHRWVRPVHWLLALHGEEALEIQLFGMRSSNATRGHRFKSSEAVVVASPAHYLDALREAYVVVDPDERRTRLVEQLKAGAGAIGGELVADDGLLDEVVDLVEWPGAVAGRFEADFLELPRELLVTTLRHHQKCFSVQSADGTLLAGFLAVSNTDGDPAGHIRRGNEWVVGGRLEDARFFWREDRKRTLDARSADLAQVMFHAKAGSFADKARRMDGLARELATRLDMSEAEHERAGEAARLAKNDLVTGTVGEFPELQGQVGGLLLRADGGDDETAGAIYSHYKPTGPDDGLPPSGVGSVVAVADKLDSLSQLTRAGEVAKGSRDPFGLRRAAGGIFRIAIERSWPLSLEGLAGLVDGGGEFPQRFAALFENFLKDRGATVNEVRAVLRPEIAPAEFRSWHLFDVVARLEALRVVRTRDDFAHLVDLTKRVDNIIAKNPEAAGSVADGFEESEAAARRLDDDVEQRGPELARLSDEKQYDGVVEGLARFIEPVDTFFEQVLVIDAQNPDATRHRYALLTKLRDLLTRYFDVRELAGQADRRG
ncbi:MAG: glycine--tRNA ligase subunit beta [bacterium]|nr:glycine--tRNA ligase subunit beta [bacterium]